MSHCSVPAEKSSSRSGVPQPWRCAAVMATLASAPVPVAAPPPERSDRLAEPEASPPPERPSASEGSAPSEPEESSLSEPLFEPDPEPDPESLSDPGSLSEPEWARRLASCPGGRAGPAGCR